MESITANSLVLFLACITPVAIILFRIATKNTTSKKLPPGPLSLPIIGHMHLFYGSELSHQLMQRLSKHHGPLMHLRMGSVLCVVASSPEIAKELLQTKDSSFSNRPINPAIEILTYGNNSETRSQSFASSPYGPFTRLVKKMTVSECLGNKALERSQPVRREEIRLYLQHLHDKASRGEAVNVKFECGRCVNNVISRMVMSKKNCESDSDVGVMLKRLKEVADLMVNYNLSDCVWFLKKVFFLQGHVKLCRDIIAEGDPMMDEIIVEHEEAEMKKMDLVDALLDVSRDDTCPVKVTRDAIKAIILDLLLPARATSAIAIQWALSELINHPSIMEKAIQEIDTVVGMDRLVQESDISNLPYLQAIVKESFRLHPTIPIILRDTVEECKVGEYHIPAKTNVFINVYAIGRDPNVWENPLEFSPERFLGSQQNVDLKGQHFELLIFGSGRRICPAITHALQVVHTTLAAMIQCFEWKSAGNDGKVDMEEASGISLAKAHPLVCFPVARQKSIPV